jgi:hypothetical protein
MTGALMALFWVTLALIGAMGALAFVLGMRGV